MSGYSGKDGKYYDTYEEAHTANQNWDIAYNNNDSGGSSSSSPSPSSSSDSSSYSSPVNSAANEAAIKFAEWANKVVKEATEKFMNNGDYKEAIDFFSKHISDWDDIPAQFIYPMAFCYECLNDYDKAIHYYGEAFRIYGRAYQLVARARVYTKVKNWDRARFDCEKVMDNESNASDHENMGEAFYYRGLSFQNMGNPKRAISDYKMSADYGNEDAKPELKKLGVYYSPKRPPKTLQTPLLLALIISIAIFFLPAIIGSFLGHSMFSFTYFAWALTTVSIPYVIVSHFLRKTRYKVHPLKKQILFAITVCLILGAFIGINVKLANGSKMQDKQKQTAEKALETFKDASTQNITVIVTFKDAYILDIPSTRGNIIEPYPRKGDTMTVTGDAVIQENGYIWLPIEYKGVKGFVRESFVKIQK
jgi:tetratricopeptide (TPR) repeat protein